MHYLDHAATTPLIPEAAEAVAETARDAFANPSSVHAFGRRARAAVETARERVAAAIGAPPGDVVFTAGGTEADNLAIKGAAAKARGHGNHLVVSAFEHHAVLDSAAALGRDGFEVSIAPVERDGVVRPERVAELVRPSTVLVSMMAVNNELGTIQPLRDVVDAVKGANERTLVHTDAVQALPNVPVDVAAWGVDLASFAAHKLGGPKGVGALYVRNRVPLEPVLHGGGHERGLRSGTLNAPGAAGFGVAAEIAAKDVHERTERLLALRTRLLDGIRAAIPDVVVNGDLERRVAGNLHVSIPGAEGETMLVMLDDAGIACSAGSACQSGAVEPSHVLAAIGVPRRLAIGSLRITLGRTSTDADVDALLAVLPGIAARARALT
ncbi:MAG TPA: cysteine desulfurase family protein [Actinomycetota bacterium]|nr:cysteine desulfurase family protein [Actinomycetota bacterium]